jgi:agmatinase
MKHMRKLLVQTEDSPLYYGAHTAAQPVIGSLNIVGVGCDGMSCARKGASRGPDAIRLVSSDLETYSPYLDLDLGEIPAYYDLGNLLLNQGDNGDEGCRAMHSTFSSLTQDLDPSQDQTRFLALGGDHAISYPFIGQCLQAYPEMVLLQLDAHADMRDGYEGHHFSHASIIRRCLDLFGPQHQLVQFGVRSGTREEFGWMAQNKTLHSTLDDFTAWLSALPSELPIYLTLDLDYFDPGLLPGTGTPEAGGEDFHSFIQILEVLRNKNLVGADVVELAPGIDPTGNSSLFAAKVVRELILAFHGGLVND